MITGQYLSASSGIISYTRGECQVTSIFDESPTEELDKTDQGVMDTMMGQTKVGDLMNTGEYEQGQNIVTVCVKIPEDVGVGDEAPDVEQYMTWTCGLRTEGNFNCMEGGKQILLGSGSACPAALSSILFRACIDDNLLFSFCFATTLTAFCKCLFCCFAICPV